MFARSPLSSYVARLGHAGGRLYVENNTGSISYLACVSDVIEVNGEYVLITPSMLFDCASNETVDDLGVTTATQPAGGQLHYAYIGNSRATFPNSLVLSEFAPSYGGTGVANTPYLGSTGFAADYRYVGCCYVSASGKFYDHPGQRYCANYYNKVPRSLSACPAFSNGDTQTTFTYSGASYALIHAEAVVEFVTDPTRMTSNPNDSREIVDLSARFAIVSTPASVTKWGVSVDSATQPASVVLVAASAANVAPEVRHVFECQTGFHTARMLGVGAATTTLAADVARTGAAQDPYATELTGWVLG